MWIFIKISWKKHPPGHDYCTQYFSTLSSLFCLHMTNIFIRPFIRFVVLCCAKSDCFKAHARFQVVTQLVSLHQCCISAIMCNLFRIPLKLFWINYSVVRCNCKGRQINILNGSNTTILLKKKKPKTRCKVMSIPCCHLIIFFYFSLIYVSKHQTEEVAWDESCRQTTQESLKGTLLQTIIISFEIIVVVVEKNKQRLYICYVCISLFRHPLIFSLQDIIKC